MINWIVLGIIAAVAALAAFYIYKAKRRGQKCIGCPYSGCCSGSCGGEKR